MHSFQPPPSNQISINRQFQSPNFDKRLIAVEFVVLHYTACNLQETLNIICDPERKVSAHIVIDDTGEIYETVQCWHNEVMRAWHAGKSTYFDGQRKWESFNDFSIGIELVNLNGNIFAYSDKQYKSLAQIIAHLMHQHKALQNPERIVGHEQVSGWRGKIDPGWKFDWNRLFTTCYPNQPHPLRKPALSEEKRLDIEEYLAALSPQEQTSADFWTELNSSLESDLRRSREQNAPQ